MQPSAHGRASLLGIGFSVSFVVLITGPAPMAHAAPKTIRVATTMPNGSTWMKQFRRFAYTLKRRTRGQVVLKLYPGGVAGTELKVVRRMARGQIHASLLSSHSLAAIVPSIRVFDVPLTFRSAREFTYVMHHFKRVFEKRFLAKGYRLLGLLRIGWIYLYSKRLIRDLADLRARKIWLWATDRQSRILLNSIGAQGVPLPLADVASALRTGRIDTVYGGHATTVAMGWSTHLKWFIDYKIMAFVGGFIIREKTFQSLSAANQRLLMKAAVRFVDRLRKQMPADNRKSLQTMLRSGMRRSVLTYGLRKSLTATSGATFKKLVKQNQVRLTDLRKLRSLLSLCRSTSCTIPRSRTRRP